MKILYFILILFVFIGCNSNKKVRVLPIVGNYDVEYDTIDGKEVADTIYPKIPFFQFKLLDPWGIPIDMLKADWSVTIEVTEIVNSKTFTKLSATYTK
jgi:hypothetical protein